MITIVALLALVDAYADRMSKMTIQEVTRDVIDGKLPAAALEGYRHIWAISEDRGAHTAQWYTRPEGAAGIFADALSRKVPGGRAYC